MTTHHIADHRASWSSGIRRSRTYLFPATYSGAAAGRHVQGAAEARNEVLLMILVIYCGTGGKAGSRGDFSTRIQRYTDKGWEPTNWRLGSRNLSLPIVTYFCWEAMCVWVLVGFRRYDAEVFLRCYARWSAHQPTARACTAHIRTGGRF